MKDIFPVLLQVTNNKISSSDIFSPELYSLALSSKGSIPSPLLYQIKENNKVLIVLRSNSKNIKNELVWLKKNFEVSDILSRGRLNQPNSYHIYFPISQLNDLLDEPDLKEYFDSIKNIFPPIRNSGVVNSKGDITQKSDLVRNSFRRNRNKECLPVDGSGIKIGVISDSFNTQIYTRFNNQILQLHPNETKANIDIKNGDLPGCCNPNGYKTDVQIIRENPFGGTDEGRAMLQIIHDIAPGAELVFYSASTLQEFKDAILALEDQGCTILVDDLTFIEESFFAAKSEVSSVISNFSKKYGNFFFTSAGNFKNYGYQDIFKSSEVMPKIKNLEFDYNARAHLFKEGKNNEIFQKIEFKEDGNYMLVLQWEEGKSRDGKPLDLDIYLINDKNKNVIGNNHVNKYGDTLEMLVFYAEKDSSASLLIISANGKPKNDVCFRYIVFLNNNGFIVPRQENGGPTVSGHAMLEDTITVGAVSAEELIREYSSYGGKLENDYNIEIDFMAPDGENINLDLIGPDTDGDHFQNFYGTSASAPHAAGAFALVMSALLYYNENNPLNIDIKELFKEECSPLGFPDVAGRGLIDTEKVFKELFEKIPDLKESIVHVQTCKKGNDKPVIKIIANDLMLEYGQTICLDYTIVGIPVGESIESLEIPKIHIKTTAALPFPDVNNYAITPYFSYKPNAELLNQFTFQFVKGRLNIKRKDLVISAKTIKLKMGKPIKIELIYTYNREGINNDNLFYATIKEEHQATFFSNNTVGLINDFSRNGNVFHDLLKESSWISTKKNFKNPNSFFNGMNYINIDFNELINYLNFLNSKNIDNNSLLFWPLINKYKPLVNKYKPLVNKYKPLVNKYKPLVNKYKPLVNKYKPLVNTEDDTDFENESINNSMHLIIDDEFHTETNENTFIKYYSINLITGLNNNLNNRGKHFIFPGGFFSPMAINFNIKYKPGEFSIN